MNEMMPYILEQPDLCQRMLANCAALAAPFVQAVATYQPDRLLLVASGTSRNAACAAAPFMEWVLGLPVTVVAPSCLEAVAGKKPLLVFISQGGNSTNTIAAIENHRDTPSLALTGNPDGEINQLCNSTVTIPCGPEKAGPKTKGYTSTVLLLYLMALEAARTSGTLSVSDYGKVMEALQTSFAAMPENLRRIQAWQDANLDTLKSMQTVYVIGKKQDALVGAEGALKLLETILTPAFAFDFEEFLHGPACSLDNRVAGFYLLPDDADRPRMERLAALHRESNRTVYLLSHSESTDPRDLCLLGSGVWYTAPFEIILPFQLISDTLPSIVGTDGVGHERFVTLDSRLKIKAKAE